MISPYYGAGLGNLGYMGAYGGYPGYAGMYGGAYGGKLRNTIADYLIDHHIRFNSFF